MNQIDLRKLKPECFNGAYREFAELLGVDIMLRIHDHFGGMTVSFPKKLLADTYLHQRILTEYDGSNARQLAKKYDYTLNWVIMRRKTKWQERALH